MMETDFHSHVLPGIDDGSHDIQTTEQMLGIEAEQGIRTVIATPHFYAERMKASGFLKRRSEAYSSVLKLKEEKKDLPEVIPAAEVYYFPGIGDAELTDSLCAGSSRVIFVEMPFQQWIDEEYDNIRRLCLRRDFDVVLVHLERFLPFQKDKDVIRRVLELPLTVQINAGCFTTFGGRRKAKKILSFGKRTILGSDCHNTDSRKPNMAEGMKIIRSKFGDEVLARFEQGEAEMMQLIRSTEGGEN